MFSLGSAFSQPETSPVHYWQNFGKFFYPGAKSYRDFVQNEQPDLYNQFKTDYLGNRDEALSNARIYQDYAKNLFANQPDPFQNYQQVGDYLYGKLGDFSQSLQGAGLRDMNTRLAALGIRPGSTGYDRLLNATRITNNLAPAFANTTNAIGRDYSTLANNAFRDTALRLGMAEGDVLNRYMDEVFARPLNVSDARTAQLGNNNQLYNQLVNSFRSNVGGFQTEETSDLAKGIGVVDNLLNGIVDLYMSAYGGGMLGGGGVGGGGGLSSIGSMFGGGQNMSGGPGGANINPYSFSQVTGMPTGAYIPGGNQMSPSQNQNWLNEFYGGGQRYMGDVNVGSSIPFSV